jgi:hypothetical protein
MITMLPIELTGEFLNAVCDAYLRRSVDPSGLLMRLAEACAEPAAALTDASSLGDREHAELLRSQGEQIRMLSLKLRAETPAYYDETLVKARRRGTTPPSVI